MVTLKQRDTVTAIALLSLVFISITISTLRMSVADTAPSPKFSLDYHPPIRFEAHRFTPLASHCSRPAYNRFITRFSRPSLPLFPPSTISIQQSRNRVFVSSFPADFGEGLGHRFCLLNFELLVALALNLTYTHRDSTYLSTTKGHPPSRDPLSPWARGELTRHQVLAQSCASVVHVHDTCAVPMQRTTCARLRPLRQRGRFRRAHVIPLAVVRCLAQRLPVPGVHLLALCNNHIRAYLDAFPHDDTLFLMPTGGCFRDWLQTDFTLTAQWFAHKYWTHPSDDDNGQRPPLSPPQHVHIAIHVDRGDSSNLTHGLAVSDTTFVDVAWRAIHALRVAVRNARLPVHVHVFSTGRAKGIHDASGMRLAHLNNHNVPTNDDDTAYWRERFRTHARAHARVSSASPFSWSHRGAAVHVKVHVHAATDSLEVVQRMAVADVFVGSLSALSLHVVRVLSRGVLLLPLHEAQVPPVYHDKVVPFDYARNGFDSIVDDARLFSAVHQYVKQHGVPC